MTKKLYYDDSYLKVFTAGVLVNNQTKNGFEVVLDKTAFYPTSGGQPHDLGSIEGKALLKVVDGPDGTVIHVIKEPIESTGVECRIDWPRRFDHWRALDVEVPTPPIRGKSGYLDTGACLCFPWMRR